MTQSEESGGANANIEGGQFQDDEDFDDERDHNDDDLREGENDIEYIIMNLYAKMKNLEGKYIDLSNYYK